MDKDTAIPLVLHRPKMFFGVIIEYVLLCGGLIMIPFVLTAGNFFVFLFYPILHFFAFLITAYDKKIIIIIKVRMATGLFLSKIGTSWWRAGSHDPF